MKPIGAPKRYSKALITVVANNMTKSYTQCRHCHTLFIRSERHLHPCYEGETKNQAIYIQPDIQPYQAMAIDIKLGTAPMITSRRAHKEFLKRNGYTEMGNDLPKAQKAEADHNVRPELTQATYEVMRKYR